MARSVRRLIIGVGGHVAAVDASTGNELWRTKLKGSSMVTVREAGNRIYAGTNGELFCLDTNGQLLWRNKLKGLGLGVVAFPGDEDLVMAAAEAQQRAAAAGAAGA